jgi:hypothetical protein
MDEDQRIDDVMLDALIARMRAFELMMNEPRNVQPLRFIVARGRILGRMVGMDKEA